MSFFVQVLLTWIDQLDDIDIFELHEAFAGQVLATLRVLEKEGHGKIPANVRFPLKDDWSNFKIHQSHQSQQPNMPPTATLNILFVLFDSVLLFLDLKSQKINPNGGSLAIGHPFAATGSFSV